ncbi:MAG: TIGR02281 family clan AA aspartic protease [Betaproteobacteria bacterium]|nr:TIGR02281 family clan AA aspartic protease [Betaproteobacteria bacterium]
MGLGESFSRGGAQMRGHIIAAGVWLALIGVGYVAFSRLGDEKSPVLGCEGPGGAGEIVVGAARDGHFYLDGAVNGVPVTFLVDTGASYVTVNARVAGRAGLMDGTAAVFNTAAGRVAGTIARSRSITAACVEIPDLSVAVNRGLGDVGLLGQNFLRHFEVVQTRQELRLRYR